MKLRADNVTRLQRDVDAIREGIEKTEREQAQHVELAARAHAERRAAADDPTAFAAIEQKAATHRAETRRLGMVLELRQKDLLEHERRLEEVLFAEAYGVLTTAAERRHAAAAKLNSATTSATKALTAREAAHDEYEAALAHARELCPDNVELELPTSVDEPEFPAGVERLVEALQAGPRRPLAKSAASSEQIRRQGESAVRTVGAQAAREALVHGDFERLGRLTPEQRRAAVTAAERLARTLPQNERAAEVAQRRLESVRELAAQAEAGDAAAVA